MGVSTIPGNREAGILLIDEEHRIVHFNDAARSIFHSLQVGELCYQTLYRQEAPCRNCPLCTADGKGILFSHEANCWIEVSAGNMDWPGHGLCHLLLVRSLQENCKNLFANLTDTSAYDELLELNLTTDHYRILYHLRGKYAVPAPEGSLRDTLKHIEANLVHPDDREAFAAFWDLSNILDRMTRTPATYLQRRFRKRRVDGVWSWVLQTAVPVHREESGDQIIMCFTQDIDRQKRDSEAAREPELDRLTGLYRRDKFLSATQQFLQKHQQGHFCLMAVDVEHFKLFNEWYGQEAGDRFLVSIGKHLKEAMERYGGVAGYMGDDDFAILLPNDPEILSELQNQIMGYVKQYGDQAGFQPAFGLYAIEDYQAPVRTMYDRASLALGTVKGNYVRRTCWYDATMMADLEENHKLLTQIQQALERGEFTFYAQPKCNMATGKIVGLESLVRWIHPERGVIGPGEFLPLLERNGFISTMDQYIWELVCASVRRWIDAGHRAIPISVNVSRADLYTLDVVACFSQLVQKYQLNPALIEVEITESAYVEDFQMITDMVDKLRRAGFVVLMDDFGSGYSSLNMLKDIKLDVLKIDMKFLSMDSQSADKGIGILEAITSMAHLMGLRVIAEGVETREQMEFLLDIGCLYGQGYYFYRPMSMEVIEPLLADESNIDFRGIQAATVDSLELRELLNGDQLSETVVNNILGGAAIYDVCGDRVELLQANQQYCRVTRTNSVDLEEHRRTLMENVYQEDRSRLLDIFRRARLDTINGAEGDIRRILADGDSIWMHLRAFFLREQDGHSLYYSSIGDVTEQKRREQQLESSQRALTAVVHLSENDEAFMRLAEENRRAAAAIFAQMTPGGMIGGYCEDGFPLYFANHEMVKLLGYETYDEFAAAIGCRVENTIHPDDRGRVAQDLGPRYFAGMEYTTTYRMPRKDGSWFWTLDKGRVIRAEDGRLAIVSACTDISETMMAQEQLAERNALLLRQNQELNFLNRDMPGGYHRCANTPTFDFIYISDRFLQIFGFSREEIQERFDNQFLNMVHPEDRRLVIEGTIGIREATDVYNLEYRMLTKHGYIWVVDQSRFMDYGGNRFYQGVIIDITETVTLRNKLQMLLYNMPEDIILVTIREGRPCFEAMANGLSREQGVTLEAYQQVLEDGSYASCYGPEELARLSNALETAMGERRNCQEVTRLTRSDGSPLWVTLEARFMQEGPEGYTYLFLCGDVTAIKQKEQELCLAGEQMESILRQAGINSWDWDIPHDTLILRNVMPNPRLARQYPRLGLARVVVEQFPACVRMLASVPEEYRLELADFLEKIRSGKIADRFQTEVPVQVPEGEDVWLRMACEVLRDDKGRPVKAVGYYTDVTDQRAQIIRTREERKALELLRRQALYYFTVNLTQNTVGGAKSQELWIRETGAQTVPAYMEMVHYLRDHLVLPEFQAAFLSFADRERMLIQSRRKGTMESLEYQRLYHNCPKWMRMEVHYVSFEDLPDAFAYIFVVDIDQQKRQELELTHLAQTDDMTGLYNRRAAMDIIRGILREMQGQTAAFIMFDLDNFKQANDMFGHAFGDSVISTVAEKLKSFFRSNDIVCRLGGDEFLVFCRNISREVVERKLASIIMEIVLTRSNGEQEILFTLSAGYAMAPEQGSTFDALYREADIALFTAKADGKKGFRQYHPTMKAVRNHLDE